MEKSVMGSEYPTLTTSQASKTLYIDEWRADEFLSERGAVCSEIKRII
jgi:hypothetical protein